MQSTFGINLLFTFVIGIKKSNTYFKTDNTISSFLGGKTITNMVQNTVFTGNQIHVILSI